jgi:hypothetical protein
MTLFKHQLTLFERGMGYDGPQSHYLLASWHPNGSLTWRWLLWWWPPRSWRRPWGTFAFMTQALTPAPSPREDGT